MFQNLQKLRNSFDVNHFTAVQKKRKVSCAKSSVEPQLSHTSSHQCPNTHQCLSHPVNSLIKIFSGACPGLKLRAQPHFINENDEKKRGTGSS